MDFTLGKVGAKAASAGIQPDSAKTAPSKFDAIRSDLAAQLVSQLKPPEAAPISPAQKTMLENDLRQRLRDGGGQAVLDSLHQQVSGAETRLQELKQTVSRLPEVDALSPLRERLQSLEADYAASDDLLKKLPAIDNPQELLNVQMKLYGMTQNLELMSKVVDQLSSGIKTVLDTRVG